MIGSEELNLRLHLLKYIKNSVMWPMALNNLIFFFSSRSISVHIMPNWDKSIEDFRILFKLSGLLKNLQNEGLVQILFVENNPSIFQVCSKNLLCNLTNPIWVLSQQRYLSYTSERSLKKPGFCLYQNMFEVFYSKKFEKEMIRLID